MALQQTGFDGRSAKARNQRGGGKRKPPAPKTLAEAAARALSETDSYEAAAERLLAILTPALRAEMLEDWERRAALAAVRIAASVARKEAWAPRVAPRAEVNAAGAVRALAAGSAASLLDFRLPGGARLGDALREDVEKAARFFHSQAADMRWKALFLDRVASATPAGRPVAAALDDAGLRVLQAQAQGQ